MVRVSWKLLGYSQRSRSILPKSEAFAGIDKIHTLGFMFAAEIVPSTICKTVGLDLS